MSVEIRELVLRATIINATGQSQSSASTSQSQEEIIAACTEQVLQILRRERER
ncbi:MAG: hypothetical protein F6J87_28430 [Spirulina sp. SIO3F2]|nr:hypothetical protein [Spirulina sp. SIO3F2]